MVTSTIFDHLIGMEYKSRNITTTMFMNTNDTTNNYGCTNDTTNDASNISMMNEGGYDSTISIATTDNQTSTSYISELKKSTSKSFLGLEDTHSELALARRMKPSQTISIKRDIKDC
jgi:hypothetical protein